MVRMGESAGLGLVEVGSQEARGVLSRRFALALRCALFVVDFADRRAVVTAFPYLRVELAVSEVWGLGAMSHRAERLERGADVRADRSPDTKRVLVAHGAGRRW